MFTDLNLIEINKISSQDINHQKIILANEATSMLHGAEASVEAAQIAKNSFSRKKHSRKVLSELPKSSEGVSKLPPGAIRTPGAAQERPRSHIWYDLVYFDYLRTALPGPVGHPRPTVPTRPYVPFIYYFLLYFSLLYVFLSLPSRRTSGVGGVSAGGGLRLWRGWALRGRAR